MPHQSAIHRIRVHVIQLLVLLFMAVHVEVVNLACQNLGSSSSRAFYTENSTGRNEWRKDPFIPWLHSWFPVDRASRDRGFVISAANVFNNEFESPWLVDFAGDSDIAARYRLVV
jgi:hypothetical protein